MSILNDKQITAVCSDVGAMITPFVGEQVRELFGRKIISYGLSSYGYDVRVTDEFRLATPAFGRALDPKSIDDTLLPIDLKRRQDGAYVIPAHGFVLCRTVEHMRIPDDVMVIALGKSTYARIGVIANVTPLEPGWTGHITIELSNTTGLPAVVNPGEGICQLLFFRGERPETTYADRGGKYQGLVVITLAKA